MARWTTNSDIETTFVKIIDHTYDSLTSRKSITVRPDQALLPKIPHVFHFIWIGPRPLPKYVPSLIESFRLVHESSPVPWTIELWDDEKAALLLKNPCSRSKDAYFAATNYGMKSDILRYEILYQRGGVYVDTDYECVSSFDNLASNSKFFCGRANVAAMSSIEINNGLIGSVPNHPVVNNFIEAAIKKTSFTAVPPIASNNAILGFLDVADQMSMFNVAKESAAIDTISHTGPGMITRVLCDYVISITSNHHNGENIDSTDNIVVLPPHILNPIPNNERVVLADSLPPRTILEKWRTDDTTLAVHYWQCEWKS